MKVPVKILKDAPGTKPLKIVFIPSPDSDPPAHAARNGEYAKSSPNLASEDADWRQMFTDTGGDAADPINPETVLSRYLPVLQDYLVKRFQITEDRAADWVQSFVVEKVLQHDLLRQADPHRSRFRTFLLRCLDNFVIQKIRAERALKRRPEAGLICLEQVGEDDFPTVPECQVAVFEVQWARGVLIQSLQRMEAYCTATRRCDIWRVFEGRILSPLLEEDQPLPYLQLAKQLNLRSAAQAANLLTSAQRIFARCLRVVIGEYAKDAREVETELEELKAVLFHAGSRVLQGESDAGMSG
jgi:DNA-directed RNA polymerase specialized sigma24 family protein